MRVLVDAQRKLGIPWENPQNSLHGKQQYKDTYVYFLEVSKNQKDEILFFITKKNELFILGDILLNYQPGFIDQWTFTKYVPSIRACWSDEAVRTAFSRRSLFQISDSVEYFFENLERIANKVGFVC